MKEFSFVDLLSEGTDFCEWCEYPCRDKDKYEMLVICISIQKEFLHIYRMADSIIGKNVSEYIKNLFHIFEKMTDYWMKEYRTEIPAVSNTEINTEGKYYSIGCSRIFQVSQLLESIYINSLQKND